MTNIMKNPGTFIQEDTTINPYRAVKHGTNDQEVVAAVDASVAIIGLSDESASATADEEVSVWIAGIAKMTIASASTKGGAITGTTAGAGLITNTKGNFCVGWLLETTTVSNQVAKVLVSPFLYPTIA